MASTYDTAKDSLRVASGQGSALRRDRASLAYPKGAAITPSNTVDMASYGRVVVTAAGNAVILPAQNDDAATVTFTALTVGQVLPYNVRRVLATGTTASLATLGV